MEGELEQNACKGTMKKLRSEEYLKRSFKTP